jgi:hypothetical protein
MQASRDKLVLSCRNQGCVRVALLITGPEDLHGGGGRSYGQRLSASLNLFNGHNFRIYSQFHISKDEPSKIADSMMLLYLI